MQKNLSRLNYGSLCTFCLWNRKLSINVRDILGFEFPIIFAASDFVEIRLLLLFMLMVPGPSLLILLNKNPF